MRKPQATPTSLPVARAVVADGAAPSGAAHSPARKVLIFDDSELCIAFSRVVLVQAGFEVRAARNLPEFDQLLSDWPPDLILTDVKMPEINGATLCQCLKQGFTTAHLPVVLFSNMSSRELADLAERCGADGYLSKDGGFDSLPPTISSLCEEILW